MISGAREGWTIADIGSLAASSPNALCIGPFGSDLKKSDYVDDGVPIVFVRDVKPNAFHWAKRRFVTERKAEELSSHAIRSGDLAITKMGLPPCVAAEYPANMPDAIVTADIIKMSVNTNVAFPSYISRYLNSEYAKREVARFTAGVTRPKVTLRAFRNMPIPLPPLAEQKRIAGILDKADSIRRKRQQAIGLTEQFLRSTFLDMFGDPVTNPKGWPESKLEEVAQLQSGVTKGRKLEGKATVDVPYMRVWNVQDGHLRLGDIKDITVLETDIDKYRLETGDLLLTEGGDPDQLGRGAIWYSPIPVCIHQNHIFRVRSNSQEMIPEFLSAMIGSEKGKRYFLKMAKQTTGIASINMTQLKSCPVLLPPISLQEEYKKIERSFEAACKRNAVRFDVADNLFNSLVQRAFRGEL